METFIILLPLDLSPRLRRRLGQDLLDHAEAFAAEVDAGAPDDVLDP